HKSGTMLVFNPGSSVHLSAPEFCTIMLLGGSSMEKRKIYWNFVHSSADKIEEAKLRWQNRSFPEIEGETEFVPLPPQR
ncbi:MAG: pirin family protein, partial [Leptospiraceae bacterium]|nr:pirin family protein [Leptospiraceae bacterium]